VTYNRGTITLARFATLLLAALALAGYAGTSQAGAASKTGTVVVAKTNLGKVIVDSRGRTLYLFKKDTGTQSQCTGQCASNWPPLLATGTPLAKSGAKASLIGTTARPDGTSQVTYNGHPVYLFQGDRKAGQTNGEGVSAFGARWFALGPSGKQVNASSNSGSTSSGGGLGY
jgi:predicted lipoprotein with Yx(FWY)xxD motif